jgi:hypothetical protein
LELEVFSADSLNELPEMFIDRQTSIQDDYHDIYAVMLGPSKIEEKEEFLDEKVTNFFSFLKIEKALQKKTNSLLLKKINL